MNTHSSSFLAPCSTQKTESGLIDRLRSAARKFRSARFQRSELRELQALDDRMLKDIGLSRSELRSIGAELHGTAPATRLCVLRQLERQARP